MRAFLVACFVVGCGSETPVGPGPVGDDDDDDTLPTDTGTEVPTDLAVVINELMADNESTLNGPDVATFPDWVELVNVGEAPVPWSRLGLRSGDGTVWTGGAGELAAGERVILFADETLELGFGLDKDGDKLTLLGDGDIVLDYVDFEAVDGDIAVARIPDLTGEWVQTAWPTPLAENGDAPSPTLVVADETLFTDVAVHRIDFVFTPENYRRIDEWDRPEVHVAMEIDGVTYPDIGLALKGSASYDNMNGKPAFSVDLNAWVADTKFRGVKAFKLHNGNVYDPTRTHDYLSYQLAREAGLIAPRVGWAEVYCNDQLFGIYMVIEKADDELIAYHHPDQEDIGVILEPNEGFYDFNGGGMSESEIMSAYNEGPLPPDPLVIGALQRIDALVGRQSNDENLAAFFVEVDKEQFLTYLAWETLVMHTDGYRAPNNWRLFVNGTTYQTQWVPAGAEWTWDADSDVFPSWGGQAWSFCLDNAGCTRDYAEKVLLVADLVEALDLAGQFETLSAMLDPYIDADPRYNPQWGSVGSARSSSRQRLSENPGRARSQVYDRFPDLQP